MHDLLRQLRHHAPISVTSTQDQGRFMYIGLRYEEVTAALVLRKRTPLEPGDISLVHDGAPARIAGSSAEERVANILGWFQNHSTTRD
jgi:hypothetical protein